MITREMPKYRSHKEVRALKIKSIYKETCIIVPEENYPTFMVSHEYIDKHKPEAGGYYVQYENGYESFSPAKAFEEGYTKIIK